MKITSTLNEIPPSTLASECHPLVEEVSKFVNEWFLENWEFPDEKARKDFITADFSRGVCLNFPKAQNDRITSACKLITILFLIDDQLENLSLSDGTEYNERWMLLCRGDIQPSHSSSAEWMMHRIWAEMRQHDSKLANKLLKSLSTFMRAQTLPERLHVKDLGSYLQYRHIDVGQELLSAIMRYTMQLDISNNDLESVKDIELNVGRHIKVVNDIFSFEKELAASNFAHKEGGALCSSVSILADQVGLGTSATERVLWSICREFETMHQALVTEAISGLEPGSDALKEYLEALGYQMSGNELWSYTTSRYALTGQ